MGVAELPLRGSGGEPVDFGRTIVSHGVAELAPNRLDFEVRAFGIDRRGPRRRTDRPRHRREWEATCPHRRGSASQRARDSLTKTVRHMFRLDDDLSAFYELVREDSELSWGATGAGRMLRAPTVFEDVVKTN